jgi:hypothetical protein
MAPCRLSRNAQSARVRPVLIRQDLPLLGAAFAVLRLLAAARLGSVDLLEDTPAAGKKAKSPQNKISLRASRVASGGFCSWFITSRVAPCLPAWLGLA